MPHSTNCRCCLASQFTLRELTLTRILPTVVKNAANTMFAISFLARWATSARNSFAEDVVLAVFKKVWDTAITHFRIERPDSGSGQILGMVGPVEATASSAACVSNLATLLHQAYSNQPTINPLKLVQAIESDAKAVKPKLLLMVHVPFLRQTLEFTNEHLDDDIVPALRQMYITMLTAFLRRYVTDKPPSSGGLRRHRVRCRCNQCRTLNLFLASSTQQTLKHICSAVDRNHLRVELDKAGFDGTHETERTYKEPQTLVLTKRDRQHEVYNAWLTRCRTAHEELQRFDEQSLRRCCQGNMSRSWGCNVSSAMLPPRRTSSRFLVHRMYPTLQTLHLCGLVRNVRPWS